LRNRKTKQQLVDDNEQAARIALYWNYLGLVDG
jgi:hypothetical protein